MLCPQASRVGSFHTTALLPHTSSSSSHTRCPLTRRIIAPTAAAKDGAGDWYSSSNNSRGETSNEDLRKRTRSRHYYDSTPKHRSSTGKTDASGSSPSVSDAVADAFIASFNIDVSSVRTRNNTSSSRGRSKGVSTAVAYDEDLEDEDENQGRGWWEVPREQRGAGSGLQLDRWQEEQLLLAAANSKKKMQVQTVAANVGLDRAEVLAWVAAFRAKPKAEQAKLLAPLQQQIQQMKAEQQRQSEAAQAAEAARRAGSSSSRHQQQQQDVAVPQQQQPRSQMQQGLPFSGKNPDTGFLPFSERRAQGDRSSSSSSTKGKRLSGEVLRTLERVYGRSPWPNKDIVAGLYDLHRLPRDVVLDWFAARREMDGLPDNPRQAKQLAAAAAQQGLTTPPADSLLPAELLPAPRPAKQAAAGGQEQLGLSGDLSQQQQQERVRVQSLTAREMASIRSSLPSPRKQKGERLKQELGIKAGADASKQLEISGVTFVAKDGRAGWNRAWRKRRSASGLPAQQLDFNLWLCRSKEPQQQLDEIKLLLDDQP